MKPWVGVLGYPLSKSLSQIYHTEKMNSKGLDLKFRVLEVLPQNVKAKLELLKKDSDCLGFSVTMPYKERILFFLDEMDDFVAKVRSCNCVISKQGKWQGINTDAPAFWEVMQTGFPMPPKDVPCIFLGCGAVARTLSYQLALNGFRHFIFKNRTLQKAVLWAGQLKDFFPQISVDIEPFEKKILGERIFILNTTPLGAYVQAPNWKELLELKPPAWIFDVNYQTGKTDLCFYTAHGLSMFYRQADLAFEAWTGQS